MSWTLLVSLVLASGLGVAALITRRRELRRQAALLAEREEARRVGADRARLQHPVIDLSRCMGCATCVAVCPEQGVLQLLHGQAVVVHGAGCAGVGACARECPVDAIAITLGDLSERHDVPVLTEALEAIDTPGLFLAGEVTAHALIRTAVEHGVRVAAEVARRRRPGARADAPLDLCIVGAGPAGIACALEAKRRGLRFALLDQERGPGGTVAHYPRRKLVLTQPVELPLHGRLERQSYTKEELMELWEGLTREHELPLRAGVELHEVSRAESGDFLVRTSAGELSAAHVCLALGRRGTPVKLGVPGEELPKVSYHLIDAQAHAGRRVLVVGGGDSAVEAALALAEQPGCEVSLSYRREVFTRLRSANAKRLQDAEARGSLSVLRASVVREIRADEVLLGLAADAQPTGAPASDGRLGGAPPTLAPPALRRLANDEVYILAGGTPPLELLQRAGVCLDPERRPPTPALHERGTGLLRGLIAAFVCAVLALGWALWHADYYALPLPERPMHAKHQLLRSGLGLGLVFGLTAAGLILANLAYLARRWRLPGFRFGSLRLWMSSHVATGVLALLCALLHAAMAPRDTVGGQAFWALAALLLTGAIGRYVYACVPRATNGRELALDEARAALNQGTERLASAHPAFAEEVRREVAALVHARQFRGNVLGRLCALAGLQLDLARVSARLATRAQQLGVPEAEAKMLLGLARRAHRGALSVAHFEDLRGLLSAWRYLHRWVAALMVVLVTLHVIYALSYGEQMFAGPLL